MAKVKPENAMRSRRYSAEARQQQSHAKQLQAGTAERNEEIRRAVDAGESQSAVAKRLGVSRQRVNQVMHPARNAARFTVRRAVKRGTVERDACEACGSDENIEAHHPDYSQPRVIRWLCRECHIEADKVESARFPLKLVERRLQENGQ